MNVFTTIAHLLCKIFKFLHITLQTFCSLLVLLIILGVFFLFSSASNPPIISNNTVLVLDLNGNMREQTNDTSLLSQVLAGDEHTDTSLQHVIATLNEAAQDSRIRAVLLRLDHLDSIGLASTQELGLALNRFKQSRKPIWAWGTRFTQAQYGVATYADKIFLHPLGDVEMKGLSTERLYWGDTLRKLGINVHVFKAGAYKSAPEVFTNSSPSHESEQAEHIWLDQAWKTYQTQIEQARHLQPKSIEQYMEHLPTLVEESLGDMTALALHSRFIDGIKTHAQMQSWIAEQLKIKNTQISYLSYADWLPHTESSTQPGVAVIVAEGEISDSDNSDEGITPSRVITQIEQAKSDPFIQALVLRINSPGGAVMASEQIRQSLLSFKQTGKPLIVSMGDTAASGGYWIASAADKIVALPNTITGSIGVFGIVPTFEKSMDYLNIGHGGVSTAWPAENRHLLESLDPRTKRVLQANIQHTYRYFLNIVAQSRELSNNEVQYLAQGKVWTGTQAKQFKLIDELGGLDKALVLAKNAGKLPTNCPVHYLGESSLSIKSLLKSVGNPFSLPFKGSAFTKISEQLYWAQSLLAASEHSGQSLLVHSLLRLEN